MLLMLNIFTFVNVSLLDCEFFCKFIFSWLQLKKWDYLIPLYISSSRINEYFSASNCKKEKPESWKQRNWMFDGHHRAVKNLSYTATFDYAESMRLSVFHARTFSFTYSVGPWSLNDFKNRFSRPDHCYWFECRIETGQRLDVSISLHVPVPSNLARSDKDTRSQQGSFFPSVTYWLDLGLM